MPVDIAQLPLYIERVTKAMRDKRAQADMISPEDQKLMKERRMAQIDALSPELRALVHEYGWLVVRKYVAAGMSPKAIKFSIEKNFEDWRKLQEQRDYEAALATLELEL
jgi:hypothetical protein